MGSPQMHVSSWVRRRDGKDPRARSSVTGSSLAVKTDGLGSSLEAPAGLILAVPTDAALQAPSHKNFARPMTPSVGGRSGQRAGFIDGADNDEDSDDRRAQVTAGSATQQALRRDCLSWSTACLR